MADNVSSKNFTSLYGVSGLPKPDPNGDVVVRGNLAVQGGNITTTAESASLFNTNATSLAMGGEAQVVTIAEGGGTTSLGGDLIVNNNAYVSVDLDVGNNANIGVDLTVGNDIGVGNDLVVTNNANIGVDLTVNNDLAVTNDAVIGNDLSIGNDLTVGNNVCIDGDTITLRCDATTPGSALIEVNRGGGSAINAQFAWDEDYPVPPSSNPNGRWVSNAGITATGLTGGYVEIGPNDNDALITTTSGSNQTLILDSDTDNVNLRANLITTKTSINVLNTTATTVDAFGAATTLNLGADTGTTTIANDLVVDGTITAEGITFGNVEIAPGANENLITTSTGDLQIASNTGVLEIQTGDVTGTNATQHLFDTSTTTTGSMYSRATTVNIANLPTTTGSYSIFNGPTASGQTKTIAIGGAGTSGSTTNITIGSGQSGATSTVNLNGNVLVSKDLTATGATLGNIKVGVTTDNTIDTTSGNLTIAPATSIITVNAPTTVQYAEGNDRTKRFAFQSSSGNNTGVRTLAPNATSSAQSQIGAFSSSDVNNGSFINIRAQNSGTDPLRIYTGTYTAGVLGASSGVAFVDNATAYATVNPSGPTNALDLITKTYFESNIPDPTKLVNGAYELDLNTDGTVSFPNYTFPVADGTLDQVLVTDGAGNLSWQTPTSGATDQIVNGNFAFGIDNTGVLRTTDTLVPTFTTIRGSGFNQGNLVVGDGVTTLTNIDGNVGGDSAVLTATMDSLTWAHTAGVLSIGSVDGTWSYNADGTTSFPNYTFPYADGSSNQVLKTDGSGNLSWYSPSDLNTTYTYTASSATGGANLTLTGSDATTNTIKLTNAGHITAAYTSATEVTLGSDATDANTVSTIVARDSSGNFSASGATLGNVTVGVDTDQTVSTTSGNLILQTAAGVNAGTITLASGANGNITVAPNGTGVVSLGVTQLADMSRELGQLYISRNATWTPVPNSLTSLAGNNGIAIGSSNPGSGNGYSPQVQLVYCSGDTTAGTNASASIINRASSGTTASPTAIALNQVAGTWNFDGYATTGWASSIATTGSGAGTTSISPLQIQGYAREAFADNGTTVTAAGMGFRVRGFNTATSMSTANRINFIDHTLGTATYKATTFNIQPPTTTASMLTLGATTGSVNQDTFTIKNNAATTTYATFASTGATIGGVDNPSTFTRVRGASAGTSPSLTLRNSNTVAAAPATGDGTTFRLQTAGSNATTYTIADIAAQYSSTGDNAFIVQVANGDQTTGTFTGVTLINSKVTSTTISAGTASGTAGGSSVATKLTVDANKITAAVPVVFPNYTKAAANALTGAIGWQICISDSAQGSNPNGMMAFWDTTNTRWSYVHDNSAV